MIKKLIKPVLASFVIISGLLFIIKSGNYQTMPIAVDSQNLIPAFKDERIYAQATAYTAEDCKYFLHSDLISKGYRPIQLSIQNNTSKPLGLGDLSIDLPLASGNQIATQFFKETIPRAVALKVASFFFWPLMVPSTIDGIVTYRSQKIMRHDYTAKTIKNYEEIIPAYSTINRILFVKEENYRDSFTLSLQDKETGMLHKYFLHCS